MSLSTRLDKLVGLFSPGAQLERARSRGRLLDMERMYAAARPTEDAAGWLPLDWNVNDVVRASSPVVRARVRQLVRDFPYFDRAVRMRAALVVGNGIRLQARYYGAGKASATLDAALNEAVESAFERWCEQADFSGRLHFYDMQALAERQLLECGEYFFIRRFDRGRYALQGIEGDRLTGHGARAADGNALDGGIEYEEATGRIAAYWFDDGAFTRRVVRVPAAQAIHGFETLRPGQLHGISPFVACVMVAGDLAELLDSELDATRLQSKYLGFVQSNDPVGFQADRKAAGRRAEHLSNATLEYLRAGDSVTLAQINRQSGTFEPFLRFNLRTLAVGTGLTYELLTGDYDQISYSNLRGIRLDLAQALKPAQENHIRWLCRPVFRDWLKVESLRRPELAPAFAMLEPWSDKWIAPGMESPDPLKEINAFRAEVALGVRSPQEIAARRGRDYDEVVDEIAEAKTKAESKGLGFGDIFTAPGGLDAKK